MNSTSAEPDIRELIETRVGAKPPGDWIGTMAALIVDQHLRRKRAEQAERKEGARDAR